MLEVWRSQEHPLAIDIDVPRQELTGIASAMGFGLTQCLYSMNFGFSLEIPAKIPRRNMGSFQVVRRFQSCYGLEGRCEVWHETKAAPTGQSAAVATLCETDDHSWC